MITFSPKEIIDSDTFAGSHQLHWLESTSKEAGITFPSPRKNFQEIENRVCAVRIKNHFPKAITSQDQPLHSSYFLSPTKKIQVN